MRRPFAALRRTACYALVLAGVFSSAGAIGQESLLQRQGSPSRSASPSLACRQSWVQFQVSMGLIEAVAQPSREQRRWNDVQADKQCGDALHLEVTQEGVYLRYRRLCEMGSLACEIVGGCQLDLQWRPSAEARKLRGVAQPSCDLPTQVVAYRQPKTGGVELEVGEDAQRHVYRAASLWHLMLLHPDAFRESLSPLLARLRKGWPAQYQLQSALQCIHAWNEQPLREQEVQDAIENLGHEQFGVRQAAQRKLCDFGLAVLPQLRRAEEQHAWTPEQQQRIERVKLLLHGRPSVLLLRPAQLRQDGQPEIAELSLSGLAHAELLMTKVLDRILHFLLTKRLLVPGMNALQGGLKLIFRRASPS